MMQSFAQGDFRTDYNVFFWFLYDMGFYCESFYKQTFKLFSLVSSAEIVTGSLRCFLLILQIFVGYYFRGVYFYYYHHYLFCYNHYHYYYSNSVIIIIIIRHNYHY